MDAGGAKSQASRSFQPSDPLRQPASSLVCPLVGCAGTSRGQYESRRHRQANLRHTHQVPRLVAYLLRAAF